MSLKPRSIVLALIATALAALLALAVFSQPAMLNLATNSDALLPADMIWELLHRPAQWQSFEWPRIPSLVPDLLVYGGLQAAFGWRWAQLGYSMISLAALTGLAALIGPRVARIGRGMAGMAFLASTAVVLLGEWSLTTTAWHMLLLAAAFHSGPFILSVAALVLARRGAKPALAVMVVVASLGTFSDRMFVGTFLLPLLSALAWQWWCGRLSRRPALIVAGLALAGCAIGMAADRLIFPGILTRETDVPLAPLLMWHHAVAFLAAPESWFVIALNATLLIPLWRARSSAPFWWIAAASAALPSSLLAAGLWENDGGLRYVSAALWWPLILWAPILAERFGRRIEIAGALVTAAVIAAFAWHAPKPVPLLAWQDPIAACLAPTGLRSGLAEYWLARRITVASDWRMQVMQVGPQGGTRVWGNNASWYIADRDDLARAPDFRFIVMQGIEPPAITAAYGAPDQILPCPGSDVWLYRDPARVRAGLAAATPALAPRGEAVCVGPDRLNQRGGNLPAGPITVSADRQTWRPVTWGPNIDMHPGRWRVSLTYRLRSDHPGADRWLVNGQWGTLHLNESPLPPTGDAPGTVSAEVTLNREIQAVEVPTYLAGAGTLQILAASFTPLDGAASPCQRP